MTARAIFYRFQLVNRIFYLSITDLRERNLMFIPEWVGYYPEVENESKEVKTAYAYLENKWKNGDRIDIDNTQSSYLYYYCYKINDECLIKHSQESLIEASEKYKSILRSYGADFPKINYYATLWMMQLSKSIGNREIGEYWLNYYLDHLCNDRKNLNDLGSLLFKDEEEYIPSKYFVDLFPIKSKLSPYGRNFEDEIRQFIEQKLDLIYEDKGINYISLFAKVVDTTKTIPTTDNVDYDDVKDFEQVNSYIFTKDNNKVKSFIKNSENEWRKSNHLPEIGQGWIHESQLFEELRKTFNNQEIQQHARPKFLGQQHYDVYFPEYKIACEYQGDQHFRAVSYFGGENCLKSNQERDERKKRISKINGVTLIEVMPNYNLENLVDKLSKIMMIDTPQACHVDEKDNPSIKDLIKYRNKK